MTTLAIDADILCYRIAATTDGVYGGACDDLIDDKVNDIVRETSCNEFRMYLSGERNFRNDIAVTKPYKGNRDALKKPDNLEYCKDYVRKNYNAITVHGAEADDGVASDMVQNGAIHCGQDKDIYQIAGKHYNFVTGYWDEVTPEQATLNFYRQMLTGDSTDNIQGLIGVGDKTAEKLIHDPATAMEDAKQAYRENVEAKMEGVDVATYWKEQFLLIELKKDLNILDLVTTKLKVDFLRI